MKARRETILKAIERTEREMSAPYETMQAWQVVSDRRREGLGGEECLRRKAAARLEILRALYNEPPA